MSTKKNIIVVNIPTPDTSIFDDMYKEMFQMLSGFNVIIVTSSSELQDKILNTNSKVLLFVNEAVAKPKHKNVQNVVLPFVERGGLVIFGCLFSSFTRPNKMDALFNDLGLRWKNGDYHRTTHQITPVGQSLFGSNVDNSFSVKALHLTGVEPGDQLYAVAPNATTQSLVFAPEIPNPNNTMAAMKRIGSGAIVYLGDVNAEKATSRIILALCNVVL